MAAKTIESNSTATRSGLPKVQATDPEYTLSLIGLVMSLAGQPIVGVVLSAIGLRQSKTAGRSNLFALLGLIFGIAATCLWLLFVVGYFIVLLTTFLQQGFAP